MLFSCKGPLGYYGQIRDIKEKSSVGGPVVLELRPPVQKLLLALRDISLLAIELIGARGGATDGVATRVTSRASDTASWVGYQPVGAEGVILAFSFE